jgi:hypothetical protein
VSAFNFIAKPLRRLLEASLAPLRRLAERQIILQAQAAAKTNRARARLDALHSVEFCAFSQWGEDGIIDWLVGRLPRISRSFIEFGVQDYRESNTRLLIQTHNWRGLVLDGSAGHIADIQGQDLYWRHDLTATCAFIDCDNINDLIKVAGFEGPVGLLSIDVDGNDYWIWQAIDVVSPAIVVCEYNAVLGDRFALTVPYRADFLRSSAHTSNLYFGASIKALIALARRKGYEFVGTTSTGCNAFFVRGDLAPTILGVLGAIWAYPSAVREARDSAGNLTFTGGAARKEIIAHLPLVNIETDTETTLAACGEIYSPEWAAGNAAQWV